MSQDITVTDLFCGAGGSSIGAEAAGARLRMAANHWRLAIETHNTNFPNADHDCADVSQVNPRRYPRTDVLIASPECTNHSSAKTKRPTATIWNPDAGADEERSRATMMDVPRFAEYHRYQLVVVENVVEARHWAGYLPWLNYMSNLGYDHRELFLNSMVAHPTPQSRDRMKSCGSSGCGSAPNREPGVTRSRVVALVLTAFLLGMLAGHASATPRSAPQPSDGLALPASEGRSAAPPRLRVQPVAVVRVRPASGSASAPHPTVLRGIASWGYGWVGVVTRLQRGTPICVTGPLGRWCGRSTGYGPARWTGRLADLSRAVFVAICGPASLGLCRVEVVVGA